MNFVGSSAPAEDGTATIPYGLLQSCVSSVDMTSEFEKDIVSSGILLQGSSHVSNDIGYKVKISFNDMKGVSAFSYMYGSVLLVRTISYEHE